MQRFWGEKEKRRKKVAFFCDSFKDSEMIKYNYVKQKVC